MDPSESTVDPVCASKVSEVLAEESTYQKVDYAESSKLSSESKIETFTYEVQHDTELYVYFNLLDNGEPTKQNFRATVKAMKRHSLPTFERQRFTLTAEQRKRFRFFEKN